VRIVTRDDPAPLPPAAARGVPGGRAPSRRALIASLGALSAFGPLSMDLYLPALPSVAGDLGTTASATQLTMSASLVGLALGQLVAGPLSDRLGRRTPMLAGVGTFAIMSVLCALAPTVHALVAFRLLQGLGGAAGVVVGRAVVRDLFEPRQAAKVFSLLQMVVGVAPVVAPLVGAGLLTVTSWRGVFAALAVIGACLVALAWWRIPDSLLDERRHTGGPGRQLAETRAVLRTPGFLPYAAVTACVGVMLLTYVTQSSLVLQDGFGFSPQQFGLVFAANALGMVLASNVNVRLVDVFALRSIVTVALAVAAVGTAAVTVAGILGLPVAVVLAGLFLTLCMNGVLLANVNALALAPFARGAGMAAAVLGSAQFGAGAIVPPLVSLLGVNPVVMGGTMLAAVLVAQLLLQTVARPRA
jgi:DHA1 family bicyclomycin/chloramphenicol resistance-like MFS transporter